MSHPFRQLVLCAVMVAASSLPLVHGGEANPAAAPSDAAGKALVATGIWTDVGPVPEGFDPAFGKTLRGWMIANGGSAAALHCAVQPSGKYVVAIGFFDATTKPGVRLQDVVIDGRHVDLLDPSATGKPFVRLYEASDLNGDGSIQISCSHAKDEAVATGLMNIVWLFAADQADQLDVGKLAAGANTVKPIYRIDSRLGADGLRGHVCFPPMNDEQLAKILPMRPVGLASQADRPQPIDSVDLEIRGEIRDRLQTFLDRWGFSGRDQKLTAGFLSDSGLETPSRTLESLLLASRLLKIDLSLSVPFEAMLARQAREGEHAGAFVGGKGPQPRPGSSWTQGIGLEAMLAYYEFTGDTRALDAGNRVVEWYERLLANQFSVSSWGANGRYGSLEPFVWLYWHTKNPKALELAKRTAEINRKEPGGIAWLIHGDKAADHLHSCLTTTRGFAWLYGITGDETYLDDARAACDRVADVCTWTNGCVAELISPPEKHCFKTDETCCTADEVMLSYHLGNLTGQGRFYDRGDVLYYNGLRFHQWFNGNFNTYSDPYVGLKGPDNWWCCSFWGAKALCETARQLYAASPTDVYVNGFMPSKADVRLKDGAVLTIEAEANIPTSGDVRLRITPNDKAQAASRKLFVRVPGWAKLRAIDVNGQAQDAPLKDGYACLDRVWKAGDSVDVHFDLPLRVAIDNGQGPTMIAQGKVQLGKDEPATARNIVIYRGPVILAQFRLQNGCDLVWAYTGDDSHLFETVASYPDRFLAIGNEANSAGAPELTEVTETPEGVRLNWTWKAGLRQDWTVRRQAFVHLASPLRIDYSATITASPDASAGEIDEFLKSGRFCGIRMRYDVSEPSTYFDKVGYRVPPTLSIDGKPSPLPADGILRGATATLDSGAVQYAVSAPAEALIVVDDKNAAYSGIYCVPRQASEREFVAECAVTITGQSRFKLPTIARGDGQ